MSLERQRFPNQDTKELIIKIVNWGSSKVNT